MNMNMSSLRLDTNPITPPRRSFNGGAFINTLPRRISVHQLRKSGGSISCSAVAVEEEKSNTPSRIESLSQVSGVLGCQWGDEGKGKLVDILAKHFDIVARCQVLLLYF